MAPTGEIEIILKAGREKSLHRRHPWVLSGSVGEVRGGAEGAEPVPGSLVRVRAADGKALGAGYFSPASQIRVRMLEFGDGPCREELLEQRIEEALSRRKQSPLLAGTDALRLINAEGDNLPGLVVDRFRDVLVVKLSCAGMMVRRERIAKVLEQGTGAACGIERADSVAARREGMEARGGTLWGAVPTMPLEIDERGRRYFVDVEQGQKTGFFLDQRDARDLVQELAAGREVLDLYGYSGGFAVAALRGGASSITMVESSGGAVALAEKNLAANAGTGALVTEVVKGDVPKFLRADERKFDLLIVDPPPFAKRKRDVDRACRGYKDVFLQAMRRARPGAYLVVFSCSHYVSGELFRKVLFGASLDAGCRLQVIRDLGPPADHPVSLDHPEGAYLTGLLLQVVEAQ